MSRKSKLILLVVVAGAAAVSVLLPQLAARGKIAFGLQSYAQGSAVFMITNTSRVPVEYTVTVEHKDYRGWPDYLGKVLPHAPPEGLILIRFQDEPNSGRVGAWQDHAGLIHSSLSGRK